MCISVRYYFANLRKEAIIQRVKGVLENTDVEGFKVLDVEPRYNASVQEVIEYFLILFRVKDGGVFVHFEYISPLGSDSAHNPATRLTELKALADLQAAIQTAAVKHGGIPSWIGFRAPRRFWLVRGRPWREDMDRFASAILKAEFDGPDVHPESLYDVLRVRISPFAPVVAIDHTSFYVSRMVGSLSWIHQRRHLQACLATPPSHTLKFVRLY